MEQEMKVSPEQTVEVVDIQFRPRTENLLF